MSKTKISKKEEKELKNNGLTANDVFFTKLNKEVYNITYNNCGDSHLFVKKKAIKKSKYYFEVKISLYSCKKTF
jgi:hypothetical protein